MSLKLLPYEKRIVEKLPPLSMIHIEYLKQKYRHQILRAVSDINREIKESNSLEHEYFWFEMFDNLFWDHKRYEILTIDGFEKWLIENLQFRLTGFDKCRTSRLIRKEITGGRMYRSRIFDIINDKYFEICVEKLLIAGVSNPYEKAHNAFEDAEIWHIDFEEDEEDFLYGVKNVLDVYCQTEKRHNINLKIIQPIQIIV
jgi:predicted nucleic-acid-binding Zn-ribbon protein